VIAYRHTVVDSGNAYNNDDNNNNNNNKPAVGTLVVVVRLLSRLKRGRNNEMKLQQMMCADDVAIDR